MVVDCHCHLDERMLKTDELIERMERAGVDRNAIIATVVDPLPETPPVLINMLHFLLRRSYLRDMGKMFCANLTDDGGINILGKTYTIYSDPDNKSVFDAVKSYPDKFYGWVFVNPRGKNDPIQEIQKWIDTPGCVGIKAHPFWHRYPPAELLPVAEMAVRLKKPLLIHVGFKEHGDFMILSDRFPELKLLLAHAGFPCYGDTWKIIKERKNICVDLSATAYVGEKIARDVVAYLGADRCFYGTDGPYGPCTPDEKYDYGYLKRRIEKLFPDEKTKSMILGENFMRFAGI
ncbi:MAG: amidohydrolase family protein [Spirochaetes bacterium]|nr:amidohydrolase family protein [Spirochaetota bacterium]